MELINFFNELTEIQRTSKFDNRYHLSQLNRFVDPTQLDIHSSIFDGYVDTTPNVRCPNENLCPQFTPEQKEFMGECTRVHIEFIDDDDYFTVWYFPKFDVFVRFGGARNSYDYFSNNEVKIVKPQEYTAIRYV